MTLFLGLLIVIGLIVVVLMHRIAAPSTQNVLGGSVPVKESCMHEGCDTVFVAGDLSYCVACGGVFCERHITQTTWYSGKPESVCHSCLKMADDRGTVV